MILEVVPATPLHVRLLAPHLRNADRVELEHGSGETPTGALTRGLAVSSESFTVLAPEGPICIFGICPVEGGAGVWLLGSDGIKTHYREFARRSRGIWEALARRYGTLYNLIHPENKLHLRWLQWLGAEFGDPCPHPISGEPFVPFAYAPD